MMQAMRFLLAATLWLLPLLATRADDAAYQQALAAAVRSAAARVLPSIVTIEIISAGGEASGDVEQDAPTSGVVVDPSGLILGSSIVVRRPAASILVVLPDGTRHAAKVVARDHHRELVLLRITTAPSLTAIDLSSKPDLRIGATTIAVGRYGGQSAPMVSRGVLSATGRLDGIALQSDARVSPALYGGPLIDLRGNVLGILIAAVAEGGAEDSTSWYDSGIAFAIPADVILRKLDRLKSGQDVKKGLLGIVGKSRDPYEDGADVAAVRTRSPAEAAGIKAGDRILTVDGKEVRRHQEIRQVLGSFDAGEQVRVGLSRDGKPFEVEVELAESIPPLRPQRLGIVVGEQAPAEPPAPGETAAPAETAAQVVIEAVLPASPADGPLQSGDVLLRLGEAEVADGESLRRQLISAEPNKPIQVAYRRGDQQGEASITPVSIAGAIVVQTPEAWNASGQAEWQVQELKLPEAANAAAYVAPPADDVTARLGLLVLLLGSTQGAPAEVLKNWAEPARQSGVVVCAIAPEESRRWQPKEIEVVASFAAAVLKKANIDRTAVAVAAAGALASGKVEAADSMALAVAMSQSSTFFGVAISAETRPPAVRLRENEPSTSLQLLLPVESADELPTWGAAIETAGYPIVRGGQLDELTLLKWVRLLQAI
jgi:S1-C subfamily serine protease